MSSESDSIYFRTTWNIVLSCFATIITCTWAAVHPNMSYPINKRQVSSWKKFSYAMRVFLLERLPIFIMILVFPEFILRWALKQRILARKLSVRWKSSGWTRKHLLFAIMGGFYFYDPYDNCDKPFCPINSNTIYTLVAWHRGERLPREEIEDKSHHEGLVAILITLQASWFVLQCIARGVASLYVTKLEILTTAYIMMNAAICYAWWDKPRNTNRPLRVHMGPNTSPPFFSTLRAAAHRGKLLNTILGSEDPQLALFRVRKVPMFYGGGLQSDLEYEFGQTLGTLLVGGVFMAINCIAWSYQTTSLTELVGWRLCSLSILGCTLFGGITACISGMFQATPYIHEFWPPLLRWLMLLLTSLYVISRIALIILAVVELKKLPSDAYEVVHWTTLIPHI